MTGEPVPEGGVETEFGVPIPGVIRPRAEWTRTGLKRLPTNGPLDWAAIFEREAPVVLDLGCGNGRYTLLSAIQRPELHHIGIDTLPVVIRYATRRANQRGLSNVRFAVRDAQSFLRDYVAEGSVAEVHLYHPQPYHDRREWRRRLVTPAFLSDVHRALVRGGIFVVQTDEPAYWDYVERVAPAFFEFEQHPGPWPDAPEGRSRREILARQKGFRIYRGVGTRRERVDREAVRKLPAPDFRSTRAAEELDGREGEG
jgi:tRNA (guanine-N7-)-methyltransferase